MNRTALWLVMVLLGVGGCLGIEIDENSGRIEISGGDVNVHSAILQLITDRGWMQDGAGGSRYSVSTVRIGFGVSTEKGLSLPDTSHEEWSLSHVQARTAAGKIVKFDVHSPTGRPSLIQIHVEDGAGVGVAEVTADLGRRLEQQKRPRPAQDPLKIRVNLPASGSMGSEPLVGTWIVDGDWAYPSGHVQIAIHEKDGVVRRDSIPIEDSVPWRVSDGNAAEGPTNFQMDRRAGAMRFDGHRWYGGGYGTVTFEPNEVYIRELAQLVAAQPDAAEVLTLFFRDLDLGYARQIKPALGDELTLKNILTLSSYNIPADYVAGIREAGYAFPVEQVIKLRSYHMPLDVLQGFKRAGYEFSADELIRIRSYHVSVADFTAFRDAGYDFSIDETIKAKSYHLPVEMARALHGGGFRCDLDQLIKLKSYHVPPEYVIAFKRAGYDLSVDEIIKARTYHLNVDHAVRFKKAGYDFSLDELINLRDYHVPVEFIVQVHDPRYENFTARELIDFHQKRVSAETINKIRASKREIQP